jgi:hypothetical protein
MSAVALEGPYFAELLLDTSVNLLVLYFFVEVLLCPLHSRDVAAVVIHIKSPWYGGFRGS